MASWNGFNDLDLSGVKGESERATLEPGNHKVKIAEAEVKATRDKQGRFAEIKLVNATGQFVIDRINVHNRNPEAARIGHERLKALLVHAKHPTPDKPGDIKSLIGLEVGVRVQPGENWTDDKGNVRPGGGEPRARGAYFPLDADVPLGPQDYKNPKNEKAAKSGGSRSTSGGGARDDFEDEIPF